MATATPTASIATAISVLDCDVQTFIWKLVFQDVLDTIKKQNCKPFVNWRQRQHCGNRRLKELCAKDKGAYQKGYTHLDYLNSSKTFYNLDCLNCQFYRFPCLNCAYYVHDYEMEPSLFEVV